MEVLSERKQEMIERHLKARGIRDENVLAAMLEVSREEFVCKHLVEFSYGDTPLP